MADSHIQTAVVQRRRMSMILFGIFVAIFVLTALFAFIALTMVLVAPERVEQHDIIKEFAWALWVTVLVEVAAGIFALWRDLFGLSSARDTTDLSNKLSEVFDGLEANELIPNEQVEMLRSEYASELGIAGAVRPR